MESLALVVMIVLFSALLGGPTALLLTYVPSKPKSVRILRTVFICLLSLVGILFGFQLAIGSSIPAFPKLIGIIGFVTSIIALLYEFKILKRKTSNGSFSGTSGNSGATDIAASYGSTTGHVYAVIFKSKRQDANHDLYYQHDNPLEEKVKTMPGYLKHFGIRHPETREGVTVAYFDSIEAIDNWRKDLEHMDAKKLAKIHFYENYTVEISEVVDSYGWDVK